MRQLLRVIESSLHPRPWAGISQQKPAELANLSGRVTGGVIER